MLGSMSREQLKLAYKNDLIKSIVDHTTDPTEHYRGLGLDEAGIEEVRAQVREQYLGT
jgi:hypothetical protein